MHANLITPKRSREKEPRKSWFNYYASFSHSFVKEVLSIIKLPKKAIILDPWNGSGTTTFSALTNGYAAVGVDLNPIMNIVATSKLAQNEDLVMAHKLSLSLRINITKSFIKNKDDMLLLWFHEETANYIRYIDSYLLKHQDLIFEKKISQINIPKSLVYLSLFKVVREALSSFISSNPTWIKRNINHDKKIYLPNEEIKKKLLFFIKNELLSEASAIKNKKVNNVQILYGSATELPLENNTIDAIITSPPYCTRIDYAVATLPELSILIGSEPAKFEEIRRNLTGRTTIDKHIKYQNSNFGYSASLFLEQVRTHGSRASMTYYYKNYLQYFSDIAHSIGEISRVLKQGGYFCCVVQDSFYKELHCDLAKIILEMSKVNGLSLSNQKNFVSKNNMANINKHSKKYRTSTIATESVLFFIKD